MATFADIFSEYYSMFRGQATDIPVWPDREYLQGIRLGNNAIRKWERSDGTLWRELFDTLQRQSLTIAPLSSKQISNGILTYAAPTNMRKPPAKVSFYTGSQQTWIPVIPPHDLQDYTELTTQVAFIGSANTGYTMLIGATMATEYTGFSIDYVYAKKATLLATSEDPAATVPDMSDVNFMIQDMLASRFASARNGFGYKASKSEAVTALRNMRMENDSGTYGSINVLKNASNWGSPVAPSDIEL